MINWVAQIFYRCFSSYLRVQLGVNEVRFAKKYELLHWDNDFNKFLIYLKKFTIHLNYLKFVIIPVLIIYEIILKLY